MRSKHYDSKHSHDQFVDLVFSVAPNSIFVIRMSLLSEALSWGVKLEWPEEVVSFLEVRSNSGNLVNKIFYASKYVLLTEAVFNDGVVSKGNSGSIDLSISSLVNKFRNGCLRRITIGNVRLYSSEHVDGGLVQSNEHSVV